MRVTDASPHESLWDRAMALQAAGQRARAVDLVRVHLRLRPRDVEAISLMGVLLQGAGELEESERWLRRAIAMEPRNAAAINNLGVTLSFARRQREAIEQWELATALAPAYPLPWISLAQGYVQCNEAGRGVEAGERAVRLAPEAPAAHANLAFALFQAGRIEEALVASGNAIDRMPSEPRLHSSRLLMMNYLSLPAHEVLEAHRRFGAACPAPRPAADRDPAPDRPLRLGIVSGDLRDHSVGFFAEALLAHRPSDVAAVAFVTQLCPPGDAAAARLHGMFDRVVDAWPLSDRAVDDAIRGEGIDVLVELSGHSGGNRLTALASKPAPVVISAVGYPNTTGLPAVDWRLVDSVTDPPGAEERCTERLLRLDPCFLCYRPPDLAVEPAMPPGGPITFGSFNNGAKIGAECAGLWARLLRAVPGSRLLVKTQTLADPAVQSQVRRRLAAAGIGDDRIELLSQSSTRAEHLALYHRVHVALDSVPYNGTTTTCEALWMGVPVVAVRGDRHASRVSASLLSAAGHPEWVAEDADGFVRIAGSLAADPARLSAIRSALRGELLASPLTDAREYGRRFHEAIRACWRGWCRDRAAAGT